jgi:hypothetical protein
VTLYVTGVAADGRSCVESVHEELRWESGTWPPKALPATAAEFLDNSPPHGEVGWKIVSFPPDHHIPPHHTASIDLDFVLAGSVVMGLGDGDHLLETGDAVVMNGVGHSWTTGPEGLTFLLTRIGTALHGH